MAIQAMGLYNMEHPSAREDKSIGHSSSSSSMEKPRTPSLKISALLNAQVETTAKIPRPRNAFILYRQEKSKLLMESHPEMSNLEISQALGKQWREEKTAIRTLYYDLAKKEKYEHQLKYPGYIFKRRRTQDIKRRNRKYSN